MRSTTLLMGLVGCLCLALIGCKGTKSAAPKEKAPAPAAKKPEATEPAKVQKEEPKPAARNDDIMAREPVTKVAVVKHILIGWKELAPNYRGPVDPRALKRTKAEADKEARKLLGDVRDGLDMDTLMREYSEDAGSAKSGGTYTATPDASLVPPFKNLSLRLEVGEAEMVQSKYGWHVIKRVQ